MTAKAIYYIVPRAPRAFVPYTPLRFDVRLATAKVFAANESARSGREWRVVAAQNLNATFEWDTLMEMPDA